MPSSIKTTTRMLPSVAYAYLLANGVSRDDIVSTLTHAERHGTYTLGNGVVIIHAGYMSGATHFDASTSLYTVR